MTRIAALLATLCAALAVLSACGAPAPSTPEGACRAESRDTPAFREAERRMPPVDNVGARARAQEELALTERRAYLNCMRLRGLTPPGAGVEPLRRY